MINSINDFVFYDNEGDSFTAMNTSKSVLLAVDHPGEALSHLAELPHEDMYALMVWLERVHEQRFGRMYRVRYISYRDRHNKFPQYKWEMGVFPSYRKAYRAARQWTHTSPPVTARYTDDEGRRYFEIDFGGNLIIEPVV